MFFKLAVLIVVVSIFGGTQAGNNRPYGVSLTGFESAGQVGPNSGFAGSALVAPLAAEGFNSPRERYSQSNAFPGDPTGTGFGGFGWRNSQPSSGYGGGGSGGGGSGGGGGGSGGGRGGASGGGSSGGQY